MRGPVRPGDRSRDALVRLNLVGQLLAARGRQTVVAGAAVPVSAAPFALDPALDEHSLERRIERPFFHLKHLIRRDLNRLRDLEAVQFPAASQRPQDEHVELSSRTGWRRGSRASP